MDGIGIIIYWNIYIDDKDLFFFIIEVIFVLLFINFLNFLFIIIVFNVILFFKKEIFLG